MFLASLMAPHSSRSRAHSTLPLSAAQCSGVLPTICARPQPRRRSARKWCKYSSKSVKQRWHSETTAEPDNEYAPSRQGRSRVRVRWLYARHGYSLPCSLHAPTVASSRTIVHCMRPRAAVSHPTAWATKHRRVSTRHGGQQPIGLPLRRGLYVQREYYLSLPCLRRAPAAKPQWTPDRYVRPIATTSRHSSGQATCLVASAAEAW